MKTFLFVGLFVLVTGTHAQVRQTINIEVVQVPVAVREAIKRDFPEVPSNGTWSANVVRTQEGGMVHTAPQWYSFSGREGKSKIEIRYAPNGELLQSKGLTAAVNVKK